jgi:predicted dehydrogenase
MVKLRGGLFGCGVISEFHLKGWRRIPEVDMVALGNRTIGRAEARRAEFYPDAHTYDNLEVMLAKEQLDFVDILTAPALHREHCLLARGAGVHIVCQKPLCDSLKDARSLVHAMEDYPKLFTVHENHRYRGWFQRIRALKEALAFGVPRFIRLEQYDPRFPSAPYKLAAEHGILLEYGTHLVDMMRALLGDPIRVYARLHRFGAPPLRGENHALVVYEYPESTAVIDIASQSAEPAFGSFLLQGDVGMAYYEGTMTRGAASRLRVRQGGAVTIDERRSPTEDYEDSFYLLERDCVEYMLTGKPVTQTGGDNLRTLGATFAAYDSAREGKPVEIDGYLRALPR